MTTVGCASLTVLLGARVKLGLLLFLMRKMPLIALYASHEHERSLRESTIGAVSRGCRKTEAVAEDDRYGYGASALSMVSKTRDYRNEEVKASQEFLLYSIAVLPD
jgi:hypothetical protein